MSNKPSHRQWSLLHALAHTSTVQEQLCWLAAEEPLTYILAELRRGNPRISSSSIDSLMQKLHSFESSDVMDDLRQLLHTLPMHPQSTDLMLEHFMQYNFVEDGRCTGECDSQDPPAARPERRLQSGPQL